MCTVHCKIKGLCTIEKVSVGKKFPPLALVTLRHTKYKPEFFFYIIALWDWQRPNARLRESILDDPEPVR